MSRITLRYFASLRDAVGAADEHVDTSCTYLHEVYEDARARHGFPWSTAHLRVAVDGEFSRWDAEVRDGSEIAFIPPVSGG